MRKQRLYEQIWQAQDKKCAECSRDIDLKDTAKPGHSFRIVCKDCYTNPHLQMINLDEFA